MTDTSKLAPVVFTQVSRQFNRPWSYVEKDFPVELLTPIVTREANSKKPIYQMHKWWARRLSSVFRMLLLTSFSNVDESRRKIWTKYVNGSSLEGKVILDAMMGGGTSIVEALKLGGKVVGVDINPVAWFVTKKEVEPVNYVKVEEAFQRLESGVAKEIKEYYRTKCHAGHDAEIMYALWHKQVDCAKCKNPITIMQEYVVSQREVTIGKTAKKKTELVIFCPSCKEIFKKNRDIKGRVTCPNCKSEFAPKQGTSKVGRITCGKCGHRETVVDAVRRKGGPLDLELFCIEYYCESCGRGYKKPNAGDVVRERQARQDFLTLRRKLRFPKQMIPKGKKEHRPQSHGYRYFYELFNERQLLCLSKLLKGISGIADRNAREFLLLAFSSCLETNNIFCKYETKWQKCSAMFGLPSYHPVDRIAENNVWGTKYGRGTFVKCYEKILRAKVEYVKLDGENKTPEASRNQNYFTDITNAFSGLGNSGKNALLACQNSESLRFLPNNSVDLVATDPPYFDNLDYSRLADFFYVWLRIALKQDYHFFTPLTSSRSGEVVMDGSPERTRTELVASLTKIFEECKRVLKTRRPMIFTFHHTQRWAWQGLLKAIRDAGFSVVASHFVRSEGRTGFRKGGHISYDVCVVCRKSEEVESPDNPRLASNRSKKWLRRLFLSGNGLENSDVHSIVMGNLLTYTPNLFLDGSEKEQWVKSLLSDCVMLKDNLEKSKDSHASHTQILNYKSLRGN